MGFLRWTSGSSNTKSWKQFSNEIGAEFIKPRAWDFVSSSEVVARHRNWKIILDTCIDVSGGYATSTATGYKVTCTQMGAYYVTKDEFRFRIHRKGSLRKLGDKILGARDIEIGDPKFDNHYIVEGNDEFKVLKLFANPEIRHLIQSQPSIYLGIRHNLGFPDETYQLFFQEGRIIKDIERLKCLYKLFVGILDHLCQIGSASEETPSFD